MMSVSEEMFAWLERERIRRHLETIQETVRSLLSVHISETELVLWREDDNVIISIPEHFVNYIEEKEGIIRFSGRVYGKRGARLFEDIQKLRNDEELHKKYFSLILPGIFKGIVRFGEWSPEAKQKDDLVHFKFTVYKV